MKIIHAFVAQAPAYQQCNPLLLDSPIWLDALDLACLYMYKAGVCIAAKLILDIEQYFPTDPMIKSILRFVTDHKIWADIH